MKQTVMTNKNITLLNQADINLDIKIATKADTATVTSLANRVTTAETTLTTKADSSTVTALVATVNTVNTNLSNSIASAIAEWVSDRQYKAGNIVLKDQTFFKALRDNIGKDPLSSNQDWSIFNPNSSGDIFANRSPTSSDIKPAGTKWHDVSFGSTTPLSFISLGNNGAWQFLNAITLSRIRFYCTGNAATYRSRLSNIRIYKSDNTLIPQSWFVWGNGSNITKPQPGVAFSGQSLQAQYNSNGWGELEPSAQFDTSVSISKIVGNLWYQNCSQIQFYYSNGGVKTYTAGASTGSTEITDVNIITCDPAQPCRYGDSVASVLGTTLTAAQLTNATSKEAGRITGEVFVSAFNALYGAQPATIASYQQSVIDSLVARIAALEAKLP